MEGNQIPDAEGEGDERAARGSAATHHQIPDAEGEGDEGEARGSAATLINTIQLLQDSTLYLLFNYSIDYILFMLLSIINKGGAGCNELNYNLTTTTQQQNKKSTTTQEKDNNNTTITQ